MFNYKEFKNNMQNLGHEIKKNGIYITIKPNNNLYGYSRGFVNKSEIFGDFAEKYSDMLEFVNWEHFNTYIYWVRFKVMQ